MQISPGITLIEAIFAFRTRDALTRLSWQAILVAMVELCSAGCLRRAEVLWLQRGWEMAIWSQQNAPSMDIHVASMETVLRLRHLPRCHEESAQNITKRFRLLVFRLVVDSHLFI